MENKHRKSGVTVERSSLARNERQFVSASELDAYLTTQLHRTDGFGTVRVAAGYRLRRDDANGCNWSGDVTVIQSMHSPASDVIAAALRPIVGMARTRFNLSE
jgi:hypothetical protein